MLFGLFTSNHTACQPAVSQWNVLESLWSEASVSTLRPLSPRLAAPRAAQAEDGTANKEAERVCMDVCVCVCRTPEVSLLVKPFLKTTADNFVFYAFKFLGKIHIFPLARRAVSPST